MKPFCQIFLQQIIVSLFHHYIKSHSLRAKIQQHQINVHKRTNQIWSWLILITDYSLRLTNPSGLKAGPKTFFFLLPSRSKNWTQDFPPCHGWILIKYQAACWITFSNFNRSLYIMCAQTQQKLRKEIYMSKTTSDYA